MSMRTWINDNPAIAAAIAGTALFAVLIIAVWQSVGDSPGGPRGAYYLDLETGEFFIGGTREIPPIQTPRGGSQGVRAHIYACGDCPGGIENMTIDNIEENGAFVAYLERYTDEAKEIIERYRASETTGASPDLEIRAIQAMETGLGVRRPDDPEWVPIYSDAGLNITSAAIGDCEGTGATATPCYP